jgi:hypothetical protein
MLFLVYSFPRSDSLWGGCADLVRYCTHAAKGSLSYLNQESLQKVGPTLASESYYFRREVIDIRALGMGP